MKSAHDLQIIPDMKDRIAQFLSELTAPLFSPTERVDLVSKFHDIASGCFDSNDPRNWKSELCAGGIPLEFALAIDASGGIGLRYYVDPHCGPTSLDQAANSISRITSALAPSSSIASDLITRLSGQHLIDTERSPRSYFIHGLRLSPGHDCVYRIYFNTIWRKRDDVYDILREFLPDDDLAALASPSIAALPLFGVGYDIPEAGLDKIKLYLLIDTGHQDRVSAIASDLLGNRASGLEALAQMVLSRKPTDWRMPRMLVTVSFMPQKSDREVKFSLPCLMWEWDTFRILAPIVSAILDRWSFPELIKSPSEGAADELPLWRFLPTHLSLGVSSTRESLSVYFHPATVRQMHHTVGIRDSSISASQKSPEHPKDASGAPSGIFRAMFDTLLRAEA